MNLLRRLFHCEEATTAVEYAVMLGLIIAVCIAAISSLGAQSGGMWGHSKDELESHGF